MRDHQKLVPYEHRDRHYETNANKNEHCQCEQHITSNLKASGNHIQQNYEAIAQIVQQKRGTNCQQPTLGANCGSIWSLACSCCPALGKACKNCGIKNHFKKKAENQN